MALQAAADKDKRGPTVVDSPIRPPCVGPTIADSPIRPPSAGQKHLFDTNFMSSDTQKLKKKVQTPK